MMRGPMQGRTVERGTASAGRAGVLPHRGKAAAAFLRNDEGPILDAGASPPSLVSEPPSLRVNMALVSPVSAPRAQLRLT